MYKCSTCGTQVPRGVRQQKRITRKRTRTYSETWTRVHTSDKQKAAHTWRDLPRSKHSGKVKGKPRFIEILVPLHTGWEIAEEKPVCPACAKPPA